MLSNGRLGRSQKRRESRGIVPKEIGRQPSGHSEGRSFQEGVTGGPVRGCHKAGELAMHRAEIARQCLVAGGADGCGHQLAHHREGGGMEACVVLLLQRVIQCFRIAIDGGLRLSRHDAIDGGNRVPRPERGLPLDDGFHPSPLRPDCAQPVRLPPAARSGCRFRSTELPEQRRRSGVRPWWISSMIALDTWWSRRYCSARASLR